MREKRKVLKSTVIPALLLMLSVAGTLLFYAARATWVFVDIAVNIEKFTFILLGAMILNCAITGALLFCRVRKIKRHGTELYLKKSYSAALILFTVVTSVMFCAGVSFALSMLRGELSEVYLLYFKKSLPYAFFFIIVPFFALFFTALGKKTRIGVVAFSLAVVTLMVTTKFFPLTPYKIVSHPTVINTGKDYSVVFSTNDYGTGFVEYTYGGKEYRVFDENGGRLKSDSKIHSVSVPYEHLDNNTYTVGSQRVIEQYSYGSYTGKTVCSDEYKFTPAPKENMTCLVVSDWHRFNELAYSAVSYAGEYDAVILLGDSSPGVDFEEQVVNNVVNFSGELSKGAKPTVYVRGNHETRGEYAGKILDALGLDEFYYTVDLGEVSFLVLDSGEDKVDTHPEYGGMTDYYSYRKNMIDWLKTVEIEDEKVIALSHSWAISDIEKDLSLAGWQELDRLGASLMLSGHTHECRFIGDGDEKEKEIMSLYPHIRGYMDGGHVDGGLKGDKYVASKITLGEKEILIEAFDNSGNKAFNETVMW